MQNNRFVVLTGHLNDYPLSDLIGILRHQRKTGRLLIEFTQNPGIFYFQEGDLVDVQLGSLSGIQAICVAVALPTAPFNFNPLIRPVRRSLDKPSQRVVSELLGCWDDSPPQIEVTAAKILPEPESPPAIPPAPVIAALPPAATELEPPEFTQPVAAQNRMVLVLTAAGVMMLGLSTIIAVTSGSRGRAEMVDAPESHLASQPQQSPESVPEQPSTSRVEQRKRTTENFFSRAKELKMSSDRDRRDSRASSANDSSKTDSSVRTSPPPVTQPTTTSTRQENKSAEGNKFQLIDVVMQVEDGRVLQASISNHRSGMGAYEAMALRIARQRRYPPKTKGQQTVRIKVDQPD